MIWRAFRKTSPPSPFSDWWRDAEQLADATAGRLAPSPNCAAVIDRLVACRAAAAAHPDEAERQDEMIDGLRALADAAADVALPVVVTQHRVIGDDRCHFVAPASLSGQVGAAGKLFVTSSRLIFASGRVQAIAWHRVRAITRTGRDLVVVPAGSDDGLQVQCNTYGDAMVVCHFAARLTRGA